MEKQSKETHGGRPDLKELAENTSESLIGAMRDALRFLHDDYVWKNKFRLGVLGEQDIERAVMVLEKALTEAGVDVAV